MHGAPGAFAPPPVLPKVCPMRLLAALFLSTLAAPALARPVVETPWGVPDAAKKPVKAVQTTLSGLSEPRLKLEAQPGGPRVALTFDACSGKTDERIFSTLVSNRIPATIFATARWIRHNPETVAVLKANPDLFQVENHGAEHIPAVDRPGFVYGIATAGSPQAVAAEVTDGAAAITAAGFPAPKWFRGATARYSLSAEAEISRLGFRLAGYSLNGDDGASASAATAEHRISKAGDGAVILSHINQPTHSAGEGVVRGILALKARGTVFVRLSDATEVEGGTAGR